MKCSEYDLMVNLHILPLHTTTCSYIGLSCMYNVSRCRVQLTRCLHTVLQPRKEKLSEMKKVHAQHVFTEELRVHVHVCVIV